MVITLTKEKKEDQALILIQQMERTLMYGNLPASEYMELQRVMWDLTDAFLYPKLRYPGMPKYNLKVYEHKIEITHV